MENTGILNTPGTEQPMGLLSRRPVAEPPPGGALYSGGPAPDIIRNLIQPGYLNGFAQLRLLSDLALRGMDFGAGGFEKLTPMEQLQKSNQFFGDLSAGVLDPASNEYQNARAKFRAGIMPALKLSRTPVDDMGTLERLGKGAIGGLEDLGLGAVQFGNEALRLVGAPGADERAEELRREARAMGSRKRPLYNTDEGRAGRFLPPLLVPATTLPGVLGAASVHGALQPQPQEGQRLESLFRNLFPFVPPVMNLLERAR